MAKPLHKFYLFALAAISCLPQLAKAQDSVALTANRKPVPARNYDQVSLGIGVGLDHGGFGANLMYYPVRNVGIFGGLGYALIGIGYNAGIKLRFLSKRPDPRATPFLIGMYGYNTAIKIKDAGEYNKFFYGPTFGFGLDTRYKPQRVGYWSFALLFPIRSESNKYMDDLEQYHNVHFDSRPPDVAFSIGFHFVFHKMEPVKRGF